MRLALLIAVAVVIVAGALASYLHFLHWRETRYDDLIIESAGRHDVEPALVKAFLVTQPQFRNRPIGADLGESRGLMLVPRRVADAYLRAHGRTTWRYICPHRHFANHDPSKPEQFTKDHTGTCDARGCGQRLVDELADPATNFDVACWFLGEAGRLLADERRPTDVEDIEKLIIAYRFGLQSDSDATPLTDQQKVFIAEVKRAYAEYLSYFERRTQPAATER